MCFRRLRRSAAGSLSATALFIAATLVALVASFALTRRLPIMPVVTGIVVLIFGGLTLALQDEVFIKMKPTIVNVLFGSALLGGLALPPLAPRLCLRHRLPPRRRRLAQADLPLGALLLRARHLNEVVWRNFSDDVWVNFKVFGIMPLTILFTLTQMPLIQRHALPEPEKS